MPVYYLLRFKILILFLSYKCIKQSKWLEYFDKLRKELNPALCFLRNINGLSVLLEQKHNTQTRTNICVRLLQQLVDPSSWINKAVVYFLLNCCLQTARNKCIKDVTSKLILIITIFGPVWISLG